MAVKKFSISIPDYIYQKYLIDISENRSKFIEEMFVRGIEAEAGELQDFKTKYINLTKELRDQAEENKKLSIQLGRFKELHKKAKLRQEFLYDDCDKCIECGGYIEGGGQKFHNGTVCKPCYSTANLEKMKKWGLNL